MPSKKPPSQVEALIKIILALPGKKIVTVASSSHDQAFDISADGKIGYRADHPLQLRRILKLALTETGSLIIRQFLHLQVEHTAPNGKKMWIPQKKLYGALLKDGQYFGLNAEQLREAFSIDHQTGETLPHEPAELYSDFPSPAKPES